MQERAWLCVCQCVRVCLHVLEARVKAEAGQCQDMILGFSQAPAPSGLSHPAGGKQAARENRAFQTRSGCLPMVQCGHRGPKAQGQVCVPEAPRPSPGSRPMTFRTSGQWGNLTFCSLCAPCIFCGSPCWLLPWTLTLHTGVCH